MPDYSLLYVKDSLLFLFMLLLFHIYFTDHHFNLSAENSALISTARTPHHGTPQKGSPIAIDLLLTPVTHNFTYNQ